MSPLGVSLAMCSRTTAEAFTFSVGREEATNEAGYIDQKSTLLIL